MGGKILKKNSKMSIKEKMKIWFNKKKENKTETFLSIFLFFG
jgi:hypothetical protein